MTLGEVLMGMAILSMILVLAAGVLHWALTGSQTQQNKTVSAFLAQQQMEDLVAEPRPQSGQGTFQAPYGDYTWKATVSALEKDTILEIQVSVDGPRGARYRLSTQRRKDLRRFVFRQEDRLYAADEDRPQPDLLSRGLKSQGYSLSPADGQTLAYVDLWQGKPQIFRRKIGESQGTIWIQQEGGAQEPCFSPDGREVAFTTVVEGMSQVFVWRQGGVSPRSRGGHHDGSPTYTPDGKGLIVCRDQFSLVLLQGGSETTLVESDTGWNSSPSLSADGKTLVFMSNRDGNPEIYAMNLAGKQIRRLTDDPGYDSQPQFSGDGQRILFSRRHEGLTRLYSMNPDGTQLTALTSTELSAEEPQWTR
jgi:TolB protein